MLGLLAVLVLVFANGFFVAAEFALVSVRRSRVTELVHEGRINAKALSRATDHLDAHLAATQLGITISSLALGWVGEPALAHLVQPALEWLPGAMPAAAAHTVAVIISFVIITALHIVLGELAPKSLALQRSEKTALAVIRPLSVFLFLFRPAITVLNGMGNGLLRLAGLQPGHGEGAYHSAAEINLLVAASQEAGLIGEPQQAAVERIFEAGERRVREIMTPRHDVTWIDLDDTPEEIALQVLACPHEQVVASRGALDEIEGAVSKKDLLDRLLRGEPLDPAAVVRPLMAVPESMTVIALVEAFRTRNARMAFVVDEYGSLEGIITQTDLLEAIAGDIVEAEDGPDIVARDDGSLLANGAMPARDAFERLGLAEPDDEGDYTTLAGFVIYRMGQLPGVGDVCEAEGWRFEVVDMDGRRVDKVLISSGSSTSRVDPASSSPRSGSDTAIWQG